MYDDLDTVSKAKVDIALKHIRRTQIKCFIGVIIFGGFTLLCTCCICRYRARLADAIDVTDAAMDFLRSTKRVIFVPFYYFILQIIAIIAWIWIFIACNMLQLFMMLKIRSQTVSLLGQRFVSEM